MAKRIQYQPAHRTLPFFRQWRDYRDLTQADTENRLDVLGVSMSTATLSRLENGEQPYSEDILYALAEVYQCEPQELLSVDPNIDWSVDTLLKTLGSMQRTQAKAMIKTMIETMKEQSK